MDWMTALLDREIASDARLSAQERGLYLVVRSLQLPTLTEIARVSGASLSTVSRACSNLTAMDWLRGTRSGRDRQMIASVPFEVQAKQAELLEELYSMQPLKGEFLTKTMLDIYVPDRDYVENARPKFLENPVTKEPLELDRFYYRRRKGVEHHGPQHFFPTSAYPDPEECRLLQARDLMKKGLCTDNGVDLIVVTYRDLSPSGILRCIAGKMKTVSVDSDGPLLIKLTEMCSNYRGAARILR